MGHAIHYIGKDKRSTFIIAKTECGKGWRDVMEFTSDSKYVTCSKCLKKINEI